MIKSLIFSAVIFLSGVAQGSAGPVVVSMNSISFEPKIVHIKTNQSIEWINKSYTDHSASAEDASFDTGLIHPNQKSKPILFSKPGTFQYNCHMHGKSMRGQVIVSADEQVH